MSPDSRSNRPADRVRLGRQNGAAQTCARYHCRRIAVRHRPTRIMPSLAVRQSLGDVGREIVERDGLCLQQAADVLDVGTTCNGATKIASVVSRTAWLGLRERRQGAGEPRRRTAPGPFPSPAVLRRLSAVPSRPRHFPRPPAGHRSEFGLSTESAPRALGDRGSFSGWSSGTKLSSVVTHGPAVPW